MRHINGEPLGEASKLAAEARITVKRGVWRRRWVVFDEDLPILTSSSAAQADVACRVLRAEFCLGAMWAAKNIQITGE